MKNFTWYQKNKKLRDTKEVEVHDREEDKIL